MKPHVCDNCGQAYPASVTASRFCSRACVGRAWSKRYLGRGMDLETLRDELRRGFANAGVAYGECQCGCGGATRIAQYSSQRDRAVKGEPVRFLKGHNYPHGKGVTHRAKRNRQTVTAGVFDEGPRRWHPGGGVESIR